MTKEQVEIEFRAKLKALLKEYDAEISASDHWIGRCCRRSVRITCMIGGIYKDGEVVREYTEIDFGSNIDSK